jgi:hypothetical protein
MLEQVARPQPYLLEEEETENSSTLLDCLAHPFCFCFCFSLFLLSERWALAKYELG